jgi:prefoldin subunit 4
MASKKDQTAIDVTWEDQRNICTFGRIHSRYTMLLEQIARKKTDVDNLNDACDEVMIADDVKIVYGESFINANSDDASTVLEAKKAQAQADLQELLAEKDHLDASMKNLKAQLYAKFGSQIYLENE